MTTMTWQTGYANVHGTKMFYEMSGEGHPLLLIHGLNMDHRMWEGQFESFAKQYRVIRIDLRGHGKTAVPDVQYSLYEDINGLLEFLGIEKAHVVGLSYGGSCAAEFALAYPEKVAGLVLVSAGLFRAQQSQRKQQEGAHFAEVLQKGDLEEIVGTLTAMWYDGSGQATNLLHPAGRELFRQINRDTFSGTPLQNFPTLLQPGILERLSAIKAPTLAIAGARDYEDYVDIVELVEQQVVGARKVVLEDTAHMVPMDQPEEFNRIVLAFLAEKGGKSDFR